MTAASVYTATVGCAACRESTSGHCRQHASGLVSGGEPAWPSGQRRYYAAGALPLVLATEEQFDEPVRQEVAIVPVRHEVVIVRVERAAPVRRNPRGSKGWRRHLRREKAARRRLR